MNGNSNNFKPCQSIAGEEIELAETSSDRDKEYYNYYYNYYYAQVTVAMIQSNYNEQCKVSAIMSTVTELTRNNC